MRCRFLLAVLVASVLVNIPLDVFGESPASSFVVGAIKGLGVLIMYFTGRADERDGV